MLPKFPANIQDADNMPSFLDQFGGAVLLASEFVGRRLNLNDFPMSGLGGFLAGISGHSAVLLLNMQSLYTQTGGVDGWAELMSGGNIVEAETWMKKHSVIINLQAY